MRLESAILTGVLGVALASGCAVKFSQRSPWDIQQIQALSEQLEQFRTLAQLKSDEANSLKQTKSALDGLESSGISVGYDERGVVVRVLDTVLFDSGKAKLRKEAYAVLDQVAEVLNNQAMNQPIAVEGHTDNEPIKRSGWKDNWELSLARGRSVLTYLVQAPRNVAPARVSAVGYGEYRPIASNDTADGRRMNRRVEIVVLPRGTTVRGPADAEEASRSSNTVYRK